MNQSMNSYCICPVISERKLSRIQGKQSATSTTNQRRDLVSGLSALRTDHMKTYLDDSTPEPAPPTVIPLNLDATSDADLPSTDPLYSSWLMHRIHPERQALSEEELAELLRNDYLARLHAETTGQVDLEENQMQLSESEAVPVVDDAGNQASSMSVGIDDPTGMTGTTGSRVEMEDGNEG